MVLADNAKSATPDGTDEPQPSETISLLADRPRVTDGLENSVLRKMRCSAPASWTRPMGFGVEVKFNSTGTIILEQYSAANQGKHFVHLRQWGRKRERRPLAGRP